MKVDFGPTNILFNRVGSKTRVGNKNVCGPVWRGRALLRLRPEPGSYGGKTWREKGGCKIGELKREGRREGRM